MQANSAQRWSGSFGALIGVVGSAVTVVLTILNFQLNSRLQLTEARLKEQAQQFDQKLKAKTQVLEETRERIERYKWVLQILMGVAAKSPSDRTLSINVARLALDDAEAIALFSNLSYSEGEPTRTVGIEGIAAIRAGTRNRSMASEFERAGFEKLLTNNFDEAVKSFEGADAAYPGYHQTYEIALLIKAKIKAGDLKTSESKKDLMRLIATSYSWGAPRDIVERLRAVSEP